MSINDSLYIGISGLQANGNAISVVGNNIANTSTIGYKRERAEFSDVLGSTIGAQQLGGGTRLTDTQTLFDQGSIQQTGNPTDLAIQGNGFFVVKGAHDGQTGNFFTRDGQFTLDKTGFAVDKNGLRLQGYPLDAAGVRGTTLGDLQLGTRQSPPVATTKATMDVHLNPTQDATAKTFDPANPVATSSFQTSETVYDSLGNSHAAQVYMVSRGGGAYEYHALVDGAETQGGTAGTPVEIAGGTLQFNTNGALASATDNGTLVDFAGATAGQKVKFSFGDDIASGGTGLAGSTFSAESPDGNLSSSADGNAAGTLTDISISSDGKITGQFDNGQKLDIAQLALASFQNMNGLKKDGDNLMSASNTSGDASIDAAGVNGRGSVMQGALEGSNVDLSTELVTLISYQRAFEANSKTITTADQMMQQVSNLKQ